MADGADSDDGTWVLALEGALAENCSLEDLKRICRGHIIPDAMRVQTWHRLLGSPTFTSPDGLDSFNEIFDLENQSLLREDCQVFVGQLENDEEDKVSILSDLESLVTHYCKSHNLNYEQNNGWLHILTPLVSLKLPKNELYTYFSSILESYTPRHCHFNGVAMHLFRLLLLYHEPELCSFLDSHKIAPNLYTQQWFLSLFAGSCNLPAVLALWDYYFVRSDPFFVFFLSLVLIVNAKEDIMALKGDKEKILELIAQIPQQMEAADIHDFCSLAVLYSAQTPYSFKRGYHEALFGENASEEDTSTLVMSQALCLPVSVQELLISCRLLTPPTKPDAETMRSGLRFFLVDCRPAEQYNAGHLPTAFHLDSNLMLTEPQAFNVAVQALLSSQKQSIAAQSAAGGEHLVFFGSGREAEDQYVHMVVAFFLQRHAQYVGLVQGGFKAVHEALVAAQVEASGVRNQPTEPIGLVDHNPALCLVCSAKSEAENGKVGAKSAEGGTPKTSSSSNAQSGAKSDFFGRMRSKSVVVKEKLFDYIVNPIGSGESHSDAVQKTSAAAGSSKSKGSGKLYRNLAPVFSIDDDLDGDTSIEDASEREADAPHQELVAISSWLKRPDVINSFHCHEVKESGHAFPSYLLVTATHLYALREVEDRPGFARISVNRSLSSIMKITSKKRHPEFITFKYGSMKGEETIIVDLDRFVIPQAGDAVKLVKLQLFNNCGGPSS